MLLPRLAGNRVLVVEDDYLVAVEIARALERASAEVIGPAPQWKPPWTPRSRGRPTERSWTSAWGRKMAFSVTDALLERGIPSIFATGYDAHVIPSRFVHVKRCEKPMASEQTAAALFG